LLIALGVIQKGCDEIVKQGDHVSVLLDEGYKELFEGTIQSGAIYYYPRKASGNPIRRAYHYLKVLITLRALKADIAIDMEADSVSSMLTYLSGAKHKLVVQGARHKHRYDQVVGARQEDHEYYRYHHVLAEVTDVSSHQASYGTIVRKGVDNKVDELLTNYKLANEKLVVIHAGATKPNKMWPQEHFVTLVTLLRKAGYKPVLIGAGEKDTAVNNAINQRLDNPVPDFCNQLNLEQLVVLFSKTLFYIGNDSGPMHLASALSIPAIALYGPSDDTRWGPLSSKTLIMRGDQGCEPSCNKGKNCPVNLRCLRSISPRKVVEHVQGCLGWVCWLFICGNLLILFQRGGNGL